MRKIAICGSSPSSCDRAPWGDASWEIWGLAFRTLPRADVLFEIHDPTVWPIYAGDDYVGHLAGLTATLYLRAPHPDLPRAMVYPAAEVLDRCRLTERPAEIFTSSIAYMLGLAIAQNVNEIALFGVDMSADEEYAYQRPAAEYLIGLATGAGIAVHIPPQSALCRANFIYGEGKTPDPYAKATGLTPEYLQARIDHYARDRAATQGRINADQARLLCLEGHIEEASKVAELVRHFNRGGVIPGIASPTS